MQTTRSLVSCQGYLSRLIYAIPLLSVLQCSGLLNIYSLIHSIIQQSFVKGLLSSRHFYSLQRRSS